MQEFMFALGYRAWSTDRVAAPRATTVANVVVSRRAGSASDGVSTSFRFTQSTGLTGPLKQAMKVTIIESTSSVMQALLASPYTSQTNIITATTVYCAYPNMVGERTCVRTDLPQYQPVPRRYSTYDVQQDNSRWERPCGYCCPSLPRNTAEDRGIATFRWNTNIEKPVSTRKGADHILGDQVIAWRFASNCRNPYCRRFVPIVSHGRIGI